MNNKVHFKKQIASIQSMIGLLTAQMYDILNEIGSYTFTFYKPIISSYSYGHVSVSSYTINNINGITIEGIAYVNNKWESVIIPAYNYDATLIYTKLLEGYVNDQEFITSNTPYNV